MREIIDQYCAAALKQVGLWLSTRSSAIDKKPAHIALAPRTGLCALTNTCACRWRRIQRSFDL